jgi:hypothetical protein
MIRKTLVNASFPLAAGLLVFAAGYACAADSPLDIGSRRELLVDR